MKKHLFTLLLAVVASIGTLLAESGTCGENLTWDLTDNVLTISGSGAMTDYASNSSPWDSYRSSIATVIIGDEVTSIGNYAFYGCSGLTSITIPNSVTSIGDWAFGYCSGLTSVIIPNSVTSIGDAAFRGCSGLTSVIIPNSVTSIGDAAFRGCSGLTSVTIPNSVTSIGDWAFGYCSGLTSITIPNSVTSIGDWAFSDCSGLTSIIIPNSVTSIGEDAFYRCSGLTSVTIPNSVTSIGSGAFLGCSSLTSITIPNSVTSIGDAAFYGCSGLTSVTIPNSVTSIGDWAFGYCSGLTSIIIPNSVTSIGENAFYYVPNIVYNGTATGSPWGAKTINGYVDGYLVYSDAAKTTVMACSSAAQGDIVIPEGVTSIGFAAFSGCSGLTSVIIGNSVTSIGDYAFYNCSSLTSITIPESIKSIEESTFRGCGLTDIVLPSSLETIGGVAFAYNEICDEDGCLPSIKTITCYSQLPPSLHSYDGEYNSFEESLTDDAIIYVPADYLNTYKAHDFWGQYDVRPLNGSNTGIEDIFSNEGSHSSQPQKVVIDGKMYIALPNGHLYDALGRQVE